MESLELTYSDDDNMESNESVEDKEVATQPMDNTESTQVLTHWQGTESSDLSLISDFFPTLRTIPEICVNLKRIFLVDWGIGVK